MYKKSSPDINNFGQKWSSPSSINNHLSMSTSVSNNSLVNLLPEGSLVDRKLLKHGPLGSLHLVRAGLKLQKDKRFRL